jgi:hypothetical protein
MVRAIRADLPYNLPKMMYRKLFDWAFIMHNFRVRSDSGTSPYFNFYKKHYNLNLLQLSFGKVVTSGCKNRKGHWDPKADVGIIVGLDPSSINCFYFLSLETHQITARSTWSEVNDPEKYYAVINEMAIKYPFEYSNIDEPTWEEEVEDLDLLINNTTENKDVIFGKDMIVDQNEIFIIESLGERYLKKSPGLKSTWMVHTKWLGFVHDLMHK